MIAAIQFIRSNWMWIIIAGLCVLLGIQTIRLANEKQAHAETIAQNEKEWSIQYKTSSDAAIDSLNRYNVQNNAIQKVANDAKSESEKAKSDLDASRAVGQRLRDRIKELSASSCETENTITASGSETTTKTANMLNDMQRRLDEATDTIAKYADEAGIAGEACEKAYDIANSQ